MRLPMGLGFGFSEKNLNFKFKIGGGRTYKFREDRVINLMVLLGERECGKFIVALEHLPCLFMTRI